MALLKVNKKNDGNRVGESAVPDVNHSVGDESDPSTKVSIKAKSKAEKLAAFTSKISNDNAQAELGPREAYDMLKLPLASIHFDGNNARTRHINIADPAVNTLDASHPEYQTNQETIDSILELAEHLKREPLRQDYALYRDRGRYFVAYGHRRHLALLIAFGPTYVRTYKVYASKPASISMTRWIENAAREDVPLYQRLADFSSALTDFEAKHGSLDHETVAKHFGINRAVCSIYRRSLQNVAIMSALEYGIVKTWPQLRELIKHNPNTIEEIEKLLTIKDEMPVAKKSDVSLKRRDGEGRGRPTTTIKFPPIKDPKIFRMIIEGRLSSFDWKESDFESFEAMKDKLERCLEQLRGEL